MLDYELFYWGLPFRGNFIQLLLEDARTNYRKVDASELYPQHNLDLHYPGMAPPFLHDCRTGAYFSQMPAILMHLGKAHNYLPSESEQQTLALKVVLDCNDILMEITNHNGLVMWSQEQWDDFRHHRLADWMHMFEKTGQAHSLTPSEGYLLGAVLSIADIAATALFGTLTHSFPSLGRDLEEHAPGIAGLCQRVEARPSIRSFLDHQRKESGEGYCGGEIERSLRDVIH